MVPKQEPVVADALPLPSLFKREIAATRFVREPAERTRRGVVHEGVRETETLLSGREQHKASLSTLIGSAEAFGRSRDLGALLDEITCRSRLLLTTDMAAVCLFDPDGGTLSVRATAGHATPFVVGLTVSARSAGLHREAVARSLPAWTADYGADGLAGHDAGFARVVRAEGLRAIMAVPLQQAGAEQATIGVLYVADRRVRRFSADEVSVMSAFGDLAAEAISRVTALPPVPPAPAAAPAVSPAPAAGTGLQEAVDHTAGTLGGAVLVRDPSGRALAGAGGPLPPLDEQESPRPSPARSPSASRSRCPPAPGSPPCSAAPPTGERSCCTAAFRPPRRTCPCCAWPPTASPCCSARRPAGTPRRCRCATPRSNSCCRGPA